MEYGKSYVSIHMEQDSGLQLESSSFKCSF